MDRVESEEQNIEIAHLKGGGQGQREGEVSQSGSGAMVLCLDT